jgi:hypothetical protein
MSTRAQAGHAPTFHNEQMSWPAQWRRPADSLESLAKWAIVPAAVGLVMAIPVATWWIVGDQFDGFGQRRPRLHLSAPRHWTRCRTCGRDRIDGPGRRHIAGVNVDRSPTSPRPTLVERACPIARSRLHCGLRVASTDRRRDRCKHRRRSRDHRRRPTCYGVAYLGAGTFDPPPASQGVTKRSTNESPPGGQISSSSPDYW